MRYNCLPLGYTNNASMAEIAIREGKQTIVLSDDSIYNGSEITWFSIDLDVVRP